MSVCTYEQPVMRVGWESKKRDSKLHKNEMKERGKIGVNPLETQRKTCVKLTKSKKCQCSTIAFWGNPYVDIPPTRKRALSASCGLSEAFTGTGYSRRGCPGVSTNPPPGVSPAQRLSDALRAQERRRGAEIPPERTQSGRGAHSVPHSPTAAQ